MLLHFCIHFSVHLSAPYFDFVYNIVIKRKSWLFYVATFLVVLAVLGALGAFLSFIFHLVALFILIIAIVIIVGVLQMKSFKKKYLLKQQIYSNGANGESEIFTTIIHTSDSIPPVSGEQQQQMEQDAE